MISLNRAFRIISAVIMYFFWNYISKMHGWGLFEIYVLTMLSVIFIEVISND